MYSAIIDHIPELPAKMIDADRERRIAALANQHNPDAIAAREREQAESKRRADLRDILARHPMASHQLFSPGLVLTYVCRYMDVDMAAMCAGGRNTSEAAAKSIIATILHDNGLSYPEIAAALGSGNHSSVIASVRRLDWRGLRRHYENCIAALRMHRDGRHS